MKGRPLTSVCETALMSLAYQQEQDLIQVPSHGLILQTRDRLTEPLHEASIRTG
jgi:hypothetical protein